MRTRGEVCGEGFREHLQRHITVQLGIRRPVHLSHPALAYLGGNGVVRV